MQRDVNAMLKQLAKKQPSLSVYGLLLLPPHCARTMGVSRCSDNGEYVVLRILGIQCCGFETVLGASSSLSAVAALSISFSVFVFGKGNASFCVSIGAIRESTV